MMFSEEDCASGAGWLVLTIGKEVFKLFTFLW